MSNCLIPSTAGLNPGPDRNTTATVWSASDLDAYRGKPACGHNLVNTMDIIRFTHLAPPDGAARPSASATRLTPLPAASFFHLPTAHTDRVPPSS